MCGIAGVYFKEKNHGYSPFIVNKFVDRLLRGIEPRGRHATGIVTFGPKGQGIHLEKKDITAADFVKQRDPIPTDARIILLHTRYATQGDPEKNENNHPVRYRGTYVTHNGVISNDDTLFKDENLKRYAEVDSEIIAALLWKHGFKEAKEALEKLRGGFAIAAAKPGTHPDQLLLGRGGSYPLVVHQNANFIVWASEAKVIEKAFDGVFDLGETKQGRKTKKIEVKTEHIPSGTYWLVKGKDVTKHAFEHAGYTKRSSSNSYDYSRGAQSSRRADEPWSNTDNWGYGPAIGHLARMFEKEVTELREAGQGKAEVLPPFQDRTPEQRQAGEYCTPCGVSVVRKDIVNVPGYGRICLDCAEFAKKKATALPEVDEDILDHLDTHLLFEPDVHVEAIREVVKATKLSADFVEFMLFRIQNKFIWRDRDLEDMQKALRARYLAAYQTEWDQLLWGDQTDDVREPVLDLTTRRKKQREAAEAERKKQQEEAENQGVSGDGPLDERVTVYISCKDHGLQRVEKAADGCPTCDSKDVFETCGLQADAQGRIDLPCSEGPCVSVGRILRWGFWVCTKHEAENLDFYQIHDKMTRIDAAKVAALGMGVATTNTKLEEESKKDKPTVVTMREKRRASSKVAVETKSPSATDVCYRPGCEGDVVALMPSGYFACHEHARGVKGAKFFKREGGLFVLQ